MMRHLSAGCFLDSYNIISISIALYMCRTIKSLFIRTEYTKKKQFSYSKNFTINRTIRKNSTDCSFLKILIDKYSVF